MEILQDQPYHLSEQDSENTLEGRPSSLSFTGSTGEYFRIWIVNVVLTLATLGIYWAWAKVRTRRYFYANSKLNGQSFDYLAKPVMILKGHLILFGALILVNATEALSQQLSASIVGIGLCILPYLIYKAHRFKAINSAYRHIRFQFKGNARDAYKAYGLLPLIGLLILLASILPMLLGLPAPAPEETQAVSDTGSPLPLLVFGLLMLIVYPYFVFLQQRYLHGNLGYGRTNSHFSGRVRPFHMIYMHALFIGVLAGIGLFAILSILMPVLTNLFTSFGSLAAEAGEPERFAFFALYFVLMIIVLIIVSQYVYAKKLNYSWSNTRLGPMTFNVRLQAPDLIWIRLTNLLAIVFSLGLLTPWARIRRARYILTRVTVLSVSDIERIHAASVTEDDAVGDTAADFYDWDIGW